jgi:hypothetical protein
MNIENKHKWSLLSFTEKQSDNVQYLNNHVLK